MNCLFKQLAAAALAVISTTLLAADPFPVKPVHLISQFPPGQGPDGYLRVLAASLSEIFGQPVLVENRTGGVAGLAAMQHVAKARPDGYTLLPAYSTNSYLKKIYPEADLDLMVEFVPIVNMIMAPGAVLMVRGDSPLMTVEDLIAKVKANPGKLNYASGGIASPAHLAAATLLAVTGTSALHIPYKGGGEAVTMALLRGEVEFAFSTTSFALPQTRSGKLRALGIAAATRFPPLPEVPALRESLKSDLLVHGAWGGLFAPAKTSNEVIRKIEVATFKALESPALQKAIESAGSSVSPSRSPEEFAALVRRDLEKWEEIIKRSGIKAE